MNFKNNFKTKLILSCVIVCFLFYTSFIIAASVDNIKTINNNLNYSLIDNLDKAGNYLRIHLLAAKQLFANAIFSLDLSSYFDLSKYIAQPLEIVYKTISSPQTLVSNVSSGVAAIIQPVTETTKKVITEIISSADLLALQQKDEDLQKSLNNLSNNLNLVSGKFSAGLSTAPNAPL